MKTYSWQIKKERLIKTNIAKYSNFIKKNYKINFANDYNRMWQWSVDNPGNFWKSVWDFTKIKGEPGNILLKKSKIFLKNKFFPNSRLNYAENLLKKK